MHCSASLVAGTILCIHSFLSLECSVMVCDFGVRNSELKEYDAILGAIDKLNNVVKKLSC